MIKKFTPVLSLLAIIILLAVITLGCSQPKGDQKTQPAKVAGSERARNNTADSTMNSLLTAKTLYVCPMHAEFVSADPNAKCSICGMNVEKMSDEKAAAFRAAHRGGK